MVEAEAVAEAVAAWKWDVRGNKSLATPPLHSGAGFDRAASSRLLRRAAVVRRRVAMRPTDVAGLSGLRAAEIA